MNKNRYETILKKLSKNIEENGEPNDILNSLYYFRMIFDIRQKHIAKTIGCSIQELHDAERGIIDLAETHDQVLDVVDSVIKEIISGQGKVIIPEKFTKNLQKALDKKQKKIEAYKTKSLKLSEHIRELSQLLTHLFHLPTVKANLPSEWTINDYIINNSRYQDLNTQLMILEFKMETIQCESKYILSKLSQPWHEEEEDVT